MDATTLYTLGFTLVFLGILVIIIAVVLSSISTTKQKGKVRGGGAVIIGPIPIVFGTDEESLKTVLILAIILTVIVAVVTVMFNFMSK